MGSIQACTSVRWYGTRAFWYQAFKYPPVLLGTAHRDRKLSQQAVCYRLSQLAGYGGRRNDLIYACRPANRLVGTGDRLIVYFGGDVQDYVECMDSHSENCRHRQWNLEATARLLLARFGDTSEVIVVRPRRMESGTFSVFANFVRDWSAANGAPEFERPYRPGGAFAVQHLAELLARAKRELAARQAPEEEDEEEEADSGDGTASDDESRGSKQQRLTLIGFSKGCVPLNQLVRELSRDQSGLLPALTDIYWLDGGHSGQSDTWLTDPADLACLTGLTVRAYATPYQVQDSARPWIGRDFERFLSAVSAPPIACANWRGGVLCQDMPANIETHFRLLELFPID